MGMLAASIPFNYQKRLMTLLTFTLCPPPSLCSLSLTAVTLELALPPKRAHTPTRSKERNGALSAARAHLCCATILGCRCLAGAHKLDDALLRATCRPRLPLAGRPCLPLRALCVRHADDDQREGDDHERRLRNGRPCEDGPPGARQPRRLCDPCLLLLRHRRLRCRPAACPRRC